MEWLQSGHNFGYQLMQNRRPPKTPVLFYKIPYSSYCETATAHNVWVFNCVAAPLPADAGWMTLGLAVAVHPVPPPPVTAHPPPTGIGVGEGAGGGGGGAAQSLGGFVP
jgi:hypothetical protein